MIPRSILLVGASFAALTAASAADQLVIFRATPQTVEQAAPQLSFAAKTGLLVGQQAVSDPAQYSGPAATASASGGEIRICSSSDCSDMSNGSWTSTGSVSNGRFVQIRRAGPSAAGQTVTATATVGALSATFSATAGYASQTLAAFADKTAPVSTPVSSDLSRFEGRYGAPVTVSGGEWRSCTPTSTCTAWSAGAGTVDHGDDVQLRTTTAATTSTVRSVTVTVGTASRTWTARSERDETPDAFSFAAATGVEKGVYSVSAIARLTGHDNVAVSVGGHASSQYQLCFTTDCSDNMPWLSVSTGVVSPGAYVRVRVMPASFDETAIATLTAGTVSSDYSAKARSFDGTPNSMTFNAVPSAAAAAVVQSNIVAVTGHDGIALSVSGTGANTQYRVCNDAQCTTAGSWTSASTTLPADTASTRRWVQLQTTAGASGATVVATLSAGTISPTWSVTTSSGVAIASMGISNAALSSNLSSTLGTDGWTSCGSGTQAQFASAIAACGNATKTLLVVSVNGVELGAYIEGQLNAAAPYGSWKNVSGFVFTSAGGRGANRYVAGTGSVNASRTSPLSYYFGSSTYLGLIPFEIFPSGIYVYQNNGSWGPGFGLDGATGTPGYVLYSSYTFKAYKQ